MLKENCDLQGTTCIHPPPYQHNFFVLIMVIISSIARLSQSLDFGNTFDHTLIFFIQETHECILWIGVILTVLIRLPYCITDNLTF